MTFIEPQIVQLDSMTETLSTQSSDTTFQIDTFNSQLENAVLTNEGISYFALSNFWSFDWVTDDTTVTESIEAW